MTEQRTALVTGSAGFIGFHLCQRLLRDGFRVIGLDAMTDYYDVALKQRRHQILLQSEGFTACEDRLEGEQVLHNLFEKYRPDVVVHLAAQAGVRYSIDNPRSYVQSNLIGTHELLEAGRAFPPAHMLLASTSSVYGAKHPNALRRNRQGRYADVILCGHQKGKRSDGAQLCSSVWPAYHNFPPFHCLRPLGAARHGALQIHTQHFDR